MQGGGDPRVEVGRDGLDIGGLPRAYIAEFIGGIFEFRDLIGVGASVDEKFERTLSRFRDREGAVVVGLRAAPAAIERGGFRRAVATNENHQFVEQNVGNHREEIPQDRDAIFRVGRRRSIGIAAEADIATTAAREGQLAQQGQGEEGGGAEDG